MIQCPRCGQKLPGWAQSCQFCGADTSKVARPAAAQKQRTYAAIPGWVWGAYYAICAYFVLSGLGGIAQAIQSTSEKFMGEPMGWTFGSYLGVGFGIFTILVGIGLAIRLEAARGVANFLCGLQILFGLLAMPGAFFGLGWGLIGVVFFVMKIVDIATAAFMIYLIGETDRAGTR